MSHTYLSPAKINLFLKILHKRPDGYHELATLMQAIGLCDSLSISLTSADTFSCSDVSLPLNSSNLVIKALNLFRAKTTLTAPVALHLDKIIPREAGLGGGSSNAATTLWALNELFNRPASQAQLIEWSAELGSDVAFFLSQGTGYCTGRGEIMQNIAPFVSDKVTIIKPPFSLSTPAVYKKLNAQNLLTHNPAQALQAFVAGKPHYFNDLETPALELAPQLTEMKQILLASGFSTVMLSGSGSSLFCLGNGKVPASLEVASYSVPFVKRAMNQWYALPLQTGVE